MADSGELLIEVPADDIGILSQASRLELLGISSNAALRTPAEPSSSAEKAGASHNEDDAPEAAAEVDPLRICAGNEDNLQVVLAMNEAMGELVDSMIEKAEAALRENLDKQRVLEERKKIFHSNAAMVKRKVPVTTFMPPYFKDQFNMCPPQNAEMKRKMECMIYDPLLKEEKKWNENDLITLTKAVKNDLIEKRLIPIKGQRDLIMDKVREANATTTPEERADWNEKLDTFARKIEYIKNLSDSEVLTGDYEVVDWATIAMVNFKGQRTPSSLRLKWCNEQCPQWSKGDWSASEVKKLSELAKNDYVSWTLIASQLGTRRTPWQCFEKYKSEISSEILKREWTQEEDDRLVKLVESLQLNGVIQWDKVTYHMAGRTRQQCRTRFMRTLDKAIKHGRWTDEEDLLLMCSIGRYGAKDWRKVAKGVPGRNDGQCRERWVNVLDRANRSEEWTMEEDEKLLYAVNMFGKGHWAKISTVLPGRNQRVCKARFRSLLTTKMRICAAQLSKIREAQSTRCFRAHARKRADTTFKEFNQLVGGDDETGEDFCNRARSAAHADTARWKRPEPEVRRVLEEGLQGIAKKYSGRERRWSDVSDDSDVEELFNGIERSSRKAAMQNQQWLPVDFDPDVTEADKCQRLTEALCQVIGKQDQLRSVASQEAYESRARIEVADKLKRILIDAVNGRVQTAVDSAQNEGDEEDGPSTSKDAASAARRRTLEAYVAREMRAATDAAAHDMLHPTATTAHAAELLIAELPRISAIADPLLQSFFDGEKPGSMEEVLAHLHASLKYHKEYLQLKELLRCLLVEPLMLIFSLEDDDRKKEFLTEEYNRARDQLMGDFKFGAVTPWKGQFTMAEEGDTKDVKITGARGRASIQPKSAAKKRAPAKKKPVQRNRTVKEEKTKAPVVTAVEEEDDPAERDSSDESGSDHEEFPVDWEDEVESTVADKKTQKKKPAAATPAAKPTPARKAAPASAKKAAPAKRKAAEMEEEGEEGEDTVPVEGGKEAGEEDTAEKAPPVKRGRGRPRSKTPARDAEEGKEKETVDQEKEVVVKANTPVKKTPAAKKGKSRARKASTPARKKSQDAAEQEDTVDEEEVPMPPVKRGRSTRNSMSTTPAREINYKDESTVDEEEAVVKSPPAKKGRSTSKSKSATPARQINRKNDSTEDEEDEEESEEVEEVVVAKPPAKKGRSTRNSLASTPADEMMIDEVMVATGGGEGGKTAAKQPARKKSRATRKSSAIEDEAPIEQPEEDAVEGEEKDAVSPPEEDTVPVEKDTVPSEENTVPGEEVEDTVPADEDTVPAEEDNVPAKEEKDTVLAEEDTIPAEKDTVPDDDDEEEEMVDDTVSTEKDTVPAEEDTEVPDESTADVMDSSEIAAEGTVSQ